MTSIASEVNGLLAAVQKFVFYFIFRQFSGSASLVQQNVIRISKVMVCVAATVKVLNNS